MAVREHPVRRPLVAVGLPQSAAGWFKWSAMIGPVQLFAVLTVGPLGVSTADPQAAGFVLDGFQSDFAREHVTWRPSAPRGVQPGAGQAPA